MICKNPFEDAILRTDFFVVTASVEKSIIKIRRNDRLLYFRDLEVLFLANLFIMSPNFSGRSWSISCNFMFFCYRQLFLLRKYKL